MTKEQQVSEATRRPLQFFLSRSGVSTVSLLLPESKKLHCDCAAFRRRPEQDCAHMAWVREKIDAKGVYPIQVSKRASERQVRSALKAPLLEYKEFLLKYGKVEVL